MKMLGMNTGSTWYLMITVDSILVMRHHIVKEIFGSSADREYHQQKNGADLSY